MYLFDGKFNISELCFSLFACLLLNTKPIYKTKCSAMSSHFPTENLPSKENNSQIGSSSPRKKRTNSTPTRTKNAAEKKQILQQLVSPKTHNKVGKCLFILSRLKN